MPRIHRVAPAGLVHHVLNRGNNRATVFKKPSDYLAFLLLLREAQERVPMRILAYAVMPNHFHLALWPDDTEAISSYMRWLMNVHVRRYH
ncbi:MAG: transposase, partial [Acidobacteriota bacterium]